MKFTILALLGVASAAEMETSEVGLCETTADCETNFDAIYAEWENSETQDPAWEPVQGELTCANLSVAYTDENEEAMVWEGRACSASSGCGGWTGADEKGNEVTILNCDEMAASATKLAAGVAAMFVAAYAM